MKFGKAYPRLTRPSNLHPVEAAKYKVEQLTPPAPGFEIAVAVPPKPSWARTLELNAQEYLKVFNQPLIFRALKLLYGQPDVVTAIVASDHTSAHVLDWSYTLTLDEGALCEVRSRNYSRVILDFWTPKLRSVEKRKALVDLAIDFCAKLEEFLEQNAHLWDETIDLAACEPSTTISNVAAEKYRSAERLLTIAQEHDKRPDSRIILPDDQLEVPAVGYLYSAAALQFFVAFEALVNLLYTLLLRPEFRSQPYERQTIRSEIDLRLVSMHVFCSGLQNQPLIPGSDLWQRIIDLRNFRNDLVHGNITDEHKLYAFTEDSYLHFYSPSTDFRGRKIETKVGRGLPRAQTQITRSTVESIKATVDEAREAILSSLDDSTRVWVRSWITGPIVSPQPKSDP